MNDRRKTRTTRCGCKALRSQFHSSREREPENEAVAVESPRRMAVLLQVAVVFCLYSRRTAGVAKLASGNPMRSAAVLAGSIAVAAIALAQQTPTPPTFRAGIDLVEVDVTVLDKHRHPVTGLQADDFIVREDGQARAITAFTPVTLPPQPSHPVKFCGMPTLV